MTSRLARGWTAVRRGAIGLLVAELTLVSAAAQPSAPLSVPPPGPAALQQIPILKDAGLEQKLNGAVPLDTRFVDEAGRDVTLGQYFGARPVVLALVYYECPMLCTQVLNGLAGSLEALPFTPGQEFDIVAVSFDAGETPAMAAAKRDAFLRRYRHDGAGGVHFLTGRAESIERLTQAVGFRFAYDAAIDQYAHPAVLTVLTPDGRVSRYLFGIEFAPRDLRLALVEAGERRIGSAIDQMLLFCYHYDPQSGKYGVAITNLVRLGGVLTVAALGTFIWVNLRRERRQDSAVDRTATGVR
ncbi:MAG: SCO family protein [Acidobacteria bacterium]|nr:SCO family protein [Acidobacteriota bacterium]